MEIKIGDTVKTFCGEGEVISLFKNGKGEECCQVLIYDRTMGTHVTLGLGIKDCKIV
jgi:hypothetical protein